MFFNLEWYWWLVIAAVLIFSIPLKVRFLKWWNKSQKEQKEKSHGKWGNEE